jgi:sec-independent protein translocase protein TatA
MVPSLGFGEILIILVIALIVFGPRRLPEMGRSIGRSLREFRRAAADLRAEIEEDLDEEPPRVQRPTRTTTPQTQEPAESVGDGKASGDPTAGGPT